MNTKKIYDRLICLSVIALIMCGCGQRQKESQQTLPILGEVDIEYQTINDKERIDTIYHKIPSFSYINQDSVRIESSSLKNRVLVADFFFTHCPTICPPMTSNMKRLSVMTEDLADHIYFLSFSIDPYRDTPTRLKEYIKEHGIKAKNWHFFMGNEEETHELAKDFFNGAEKNDTIPGGFGHTPYFSLVDTKGHIRGIYDGTDSQAIETLEKELRLLLKTEYNVIGNKN